MLNFLKLYWQVALAVVLTALAVLGIWSYIQEREARVRMETEIAAQRQVIAGLEQRRADRARDTAKKQAEFQKAKVQPRTPQQIVDELPHWLPLPEPIKIEYHPLVPSSNEEGKRGEAVLPVARGGEEPIATLPLRDLKPLLDFSIDAAACQQALTSCQADAVDLQAEIKATETQRDSAVAAVKGGTFWQRFKGRARDIGIGVLIGAVAIKISTK